MGPPDIDVSYVDGHSVPVLVLLFSLSNLLSLFSYASIFAIIPLYTVAPISTLNGSSSIIAN